MNNCKLAVKSTPFVSVKTYKVKYNVKKVRLNWPS